MFCKQENLTSKRKEQVNQNEIRQKELKTWQEKSWDRQSYQFVRTKLGTVMETIPMIRGGNN